MTSDDPARGFLARAQSLVVSWRREQGVDRGEALAEAKEAYVDCVALEYPGAEDLRVEAHVGLARLELVDGDPASIRSALARLSKVLQDHPYSDHIEDVIYLLAIQAAFLSSGNNVANASGALEYLDYLRDSYAPACEGAPTARLYPRWDFAEEEAGESEECGSLVAAALNLRDQGLHVTGLPAWALQFQIGLLAFRLGDSKRGMVTMENAFTSYEIWLPRSRGDPNDDTPDVDATRKAWFHGVRHWTAWVQHPRTWLDLGDIAYRQGAGCFHMAAEAYRGALKGAGGMFPPDQEEAIAFRIAKCCSRSGQTADAIAGVERLLYTRKFWSEKYRKHLKAWSEAWQKYFEREDAASLRLQCFWRVVVAKMELRFLRAQDRLVLEYTELRRRHLLQHHFRIILEHCRERKRISKCATVIQSMYRVRRAGRIAATMRAVTDNKEAIVKAHVSMLLRKVQVICFNHWVKHNGMARLDKAAAKIQALGRGRKARVMFLATLAARDLRDRQEQQVAQMRDKCVKRRFLQRISRNVAFSRRERAATTIQAVMRGVYGRELASDERNRRARINELLVIVLKRLGAPVFREWYQAAHDIRKERMAIRAQACWRAFRARRKWMLTKQKVLRAREMGIEAIGRNQQTDKRRVVETWRTIVLERKIVTAQGAARVWLAKRVITQKRRQQEELDRLLKRVMKPVCRRCFVALVRTKNTRRKEKSLSAVAIQCWWRCILAIISAQRVREYDSLLSKAFERVASTNERRLLVRCCQQWRENILKQMGASKIQAAWRGRQARLRAAWLKHRAIRFHAVVKVLRAVYQRRIREYAFEEWSMLMWQRRMMTKLAARFRGSRARTAFAERCSVLKARQDALCRVAVAKRRMHLATALREWIAYGEHCQTLSVYQARIRGWLARRRLASIRLVARVTMEALILGRISAHIHLISKCCVGQAAWRGALARRRNRQVLADARVMGEMCFRIQAARRRRILEATIALWCSMLVTEWQMAVRLQSFIRGCRDRARVLAIRVEERRRSNLVTTFQSQVRRRRMLRCFRGIEGCLVDAYTTTLRSFLFHETRKTEGRGPVEKGSFDGGTKALQEDSVKPVAATRGESLLDHEMETTTSRSGKYSHPGRRRQHLPLPSRYPVPVLPARNKQKTSRIRLRSKSERHIHRRRHRAGHDIVWEENEHVGSGGGREHRVAGTFGLWTFTWTNPRKRSADFASAGFFQAFDKVRRTGLLRWLPARLSTQELAYLCRFAKIVTIDPAPEVEVWDLVAVLRHVLYPDSLVQATMAFEIESSPANKAPDPRDKQAAARPAVVICNGDHDAQTGCLGQALSALAVLCSSLSVTACGIGNAGAMALAKACPLKDLNELCLESCGIGNAGAVALALALGEGAAKGLRKIVFSGNRVGGIPAFARALQNVTIRSENLEVLELARCSFTDDDMAVLCEGLADGRCHVRALVLSENVDLGDRGATALAEALRARSEVPNKTNLKALCFHVDLAGCSIHTWGCLALAACVVDISGVEAHERACFPALMLNLRANRIKDVGVEAMSCATLGQDYNDHRNQQSQVRRRKHPRTKSLRTLNPCGTNLTLRRKDYPRVRAVGSSPHVGAHQGDLPPLMGTPLFTAATAAWSFTRKQIPSCSVVLDENKASERVVAGQGGLAGMGETALFRGCVLPETVARDKSWTRDAFWANTGE